MITEAALVLQRRRRVRRRSHRRAARQRCDHRRGGVQHRDERLPGDPHRPVLRRPDHHLHLHAHRQLRRDRRPTTRRRRRRAAASSCATSRAARRAGAPSAASTTSLTHSRPVGHRRHRHPPPHPSPARRRRGARARSAPPTSRRCWRRPRPKRAPTTKTSPGSVTTKEPYLVGEGPKHIVAYDFGIKRTILRHLTHDATVMVVPANTPAEAVLDRAPDGVFLSQRSRRPGGGHLRGGEHPAAARQRADLRHLPRPPAAGPRPRRRHPQARVRPPRRQPPRAPLRDNAVEITSQNHNYAVTEGSIAGRRGHARQPQRRRDRRTEGRKRARLLGAVPPRGRSRPARRVVPLRRVRRADGGEQVDAAPRRHRVDPRHRLRPDRDRPGLRVRLLGHPGVPRAQGRGLQGHPRQLEPGHDHDRPRFRAPHLRRAARRPRCCRRSSRRSAPTPSCRRSAARPR